MSSALRIRYPLEEEPIQASPLYNVYIRMYTRSIINLLELACANPYKLK
ncbi:hypothetical protein CLOSBL3_10920 [Clostridiaceae bacterium BL-3]|nr:hypothetical protein CLOSBL3_10920 [Clostridiaceae bacterium BL-3]